MTEGALPISERKIPMARRSDGVILCVTCCWGDRCDEPRHYERERCPDCEGSGALVSLKALRELEEREQRLVRALELVLDYMGNPDAEGNTVVSWPACRDKWGLVDSAEEQIIQRLRAALAPADSQAYDVATENR